MNVSEFLRILAGAGSQGGDALPVEMIYLEAQSRWNNDSIQVDGHSHRNQQPRFDVERSIDGNTWETIGVVPGHDNSTVQQDYAYNDLDVAPGVRFYYRLNR